MIDDETQKAAAHYAIANASALSLEDYLRRGRQHEAVEQSDLEELFVASLQFMADRPGERSARVMYDDLEAEFGLRKIDPPFDRAREAIDRLTKLAVELMDAASPERQMALNDTLLDDYAKAKKQSQ